MYSNTTPVTANDYPNDKGCKQVEKSKIEKIQQWFFNPIRDFKVHESFILLMVCMPLYEKYLRYNKFMKDTDKFTEGHSVFKTIGKHLKISEDIAYAFWQMFRNGICHKGMPKVHTDIKYKFVRESDFIIKYENTTDIIIIDAFAFRDKIESLIMKDINIFRDDEYPFAVEYKENTT